MIDNNTRFLGIDSTKVNLTKKKDELNNSVGAYYTLDEMAALPVETTYPVTNAAEAGKKFLYLGTEWQYMTQAQIDSTGWTGLVSVGFPAPVSRIFDEFLIYGFSPAVFESPFGQPYRPITASVFVDFLGIGRPDKVANFVLPSGGTVPTTILGFKNAALLKSLQNIGTDTALNVSSKNLTAEIINDLFTQLPTTTKTATIKVNGNPGAATCDPTIATAKGYIVTI